MMVGCLQGGALVNIHADGSVLVSHGGVEMGQGLHTKIIQVRLASQPYVRVGLGGDWSGLHMKTVHVRLVASPFMRMGLDGD